MNQAAPRWVPGLSRPRTGQRVPAPSPSHPAVPPARRGSCRPHPALPRAGSRQRAGHASPSCRGVLGWSSGGSAPGPRCGGGRPAWVAPGRGSSPAAAPDHWVIEKHRRPLQRSQSPFFPADCNQHLIHTPLFTNFPGGIMLMKGARQSSSLPEVGKRRRKKERAAAGKKGNRPGKAGKREGRTKWGSLCPTTSPASLPGAAVRREMPIPVGQHLQHPRQRCSGSWVPH